MEGKCKEDVRFEAGRPGLKLFNAFEQSWITGFLVAVRNQIEDGRILFFVDIIFQIVIIHRLTCFAFCGSGQSSSVCVFFAVFHAVR